MSFCYDIKTELSEIKVSRCCAQALTYGMLLFGRSFSSQKISMQSENKAYFLFNNSVYVFNETFCNVCKLYDFAAFSIKPTMVLMESC